MGRTRIGRRPHAQGGLQRGGHGGGAQEARCERAARSARGRPAASLLNGGPHFAHCRLRRRGRGVVGALRAPRRGSARPSARGASPHAARQAPTPTQTHAAQRPSSAPAAAPRSGPSSRSRPPLRPGARSCRGPPRRTPSAAGLRAARRGVARVHRGTHTQPRLAPCARGQVTCCAAAVPTTPAPGPPRTHPRPCRSLSPPAPLTCTCR